MAAPEYKHYVGEIGTPLVVNLGYDLTSTTVRKLYVKKPDGTEVIWLPTVYSPGSLPNYLIYTFISGDLNQAGNYKVQPYVEFSDWKGFGETDSFPVYSLYA